VQPTRFTPQLTRCAPRTTGFQTSTLSTVSEAKTAHHCPAWL
jgi:hypothetical protein